MDLVMGAKGELSVPHLKKLKLLNLLLIASLAMLLVGSAWHGHHDHDHESDSDSCLWCLVAGMVLVISVAWTGIAHKPAVGRNYLAPLVFIASRAQADPFSSRAPPIS